MRFHVVLAGFKFAMQYKDDHELLMLLSVSRVLNDKHIPATSGLCSVEAGSQGPTRAGQAVYQWAIHHSLVLLRTVKKRATVSLESPHILGSLYIISYILFVISSFTFWSWGHSVLPMLVLGWWVWESLPAQPWEEVLVNKWQRHECNWGREWW